PNRFSDSEVILAVQHWIDVFTRLKVWYIAKKPPLVARLYLVAYKKQKNMMSNNLRISNLEWPQVADLRHGRANRCYHTGVRKELTQLFH
ncbi:MAG: hypothetical protein LBR86_03850, partial [Tannerella sp.]|nr:hypothetical protein [Tannerella sp.]